MPDDVKQPKEFDDAKKAIRADIREKLADMTPDDLRERSAAACQRLIGIEPFQHAATVMLYMPLPREVDLTPAAIRSFCSGKTVCVPTIDWKGRNMRAVEVSSFDDEIMEVDERGIRSPKWGRPLLTEMIDMIVVPGLAFDLQGGRVGRGGGFYDRFLSRFTKLPTLVGLAFDEQIIDEAPMSDLDVRLDIIVTDRRVAYRDPTSVR